MGKYTDEDGVDGPFARAMRAAERDDVRAATTGLSPAALSTNRPWPHQRSYYGALVNAVGHAQWRCPHYHRTEPAALCCAGREVRERAQLARRVASNG